MRTSTPSIELWSDTVRRGRLPAPTVEREDVRPPSRQTQLEQSARLPVALAERHIGETLVYASIGLAGAVMCILAAVAVLDVIVSLAV